MPIRNGRWRCLWRRGVHSAFCRERLPNNGGDEAVLVTITMRRVEANDPVAKHALQWWRLWECIQIFQRRRRVGRCGIALSMSHMYREGLGVEKDVKKKLFHLEEAAIGGHADARYNLASYEWSNYNFNRSLNHWVIAFRLGHKESMQTLQRSYTSGKCCCCPRRLYVPADAWLSPMPPPPPPPPPLPTARRPLLPLIEGCEDMLLLQCCVGLGF